MLSNTLGLLLHKGTLAGDLLPLLIFFHQKYPSGPKTSTLL
jgi:hypothetical protein